MPYLRKTLAGRGGEGYIDVAASILYMVLALALSIKILPVSITKQQLGTFATELCREAEIVGWVRSETNRRAAVLREETGLNPEVHRLTSGRIRLNEEVAVQLTCRYNLGLLGGLGSFPITLWAVATGKSEVY